MEQAGEHLEHGRLAGAVRPNETDHLALVQRKADRAHGFHRAVSAPCQALERGRQPGLRLGNLVGLGQLLDQDMWLGHKYSLQPARLNDYPKTRVVILSGVYHTTRPAAQRSEASMVAHGLLSVGDDAGFFALGAELVVWSGVRGDA
jgi:hypothetical protein